MAEKLSEKDAERVEYVRRRVDGNLIGDRRARMDCSSLLGVIDRLTGGAQAKEKTPPKPKASRVQEAPAKKKDPDPPADEGGEGDEGGEAADS